MAGQQKVKVKTPPEEPVVKKMTNRIRELRERSRLTQEELGKLTEYDYTTISRHESGDRALDAEAIKKYARVFKCETFEIFLNPDSVAPTG